MAPVLVPSPEFKNALELGSTHLESLRVVTEELVHFCLNGLQPYFYITKL